MLSARKVSVHPHFRILLAIQHNRDLILKFISSPNWLSLAAQGLLGNSTRNSAVLLSPLSSNVSILDSHRNDSVLRRTVWIHFQHSITPPSAPWAESLLHWQKLCRGFDYMGSNVWNFCLRVGPRWESKVRPSQQCPKLRSKLHSVGLLQIYPGKSMEHAWSTRKSKCSAQGTWLRSKVFLLISEKVIILQWTAISSRKPSQAAQHRPKVRVFRSKDIALYEGLCVFGGRSCKLGLRICSCKLIDITSMISLNCGL